MFGCLDIWLNICHLDRQWHFELSVSVCGQRNFDYLYLRLTSKMLTDTDILKKELLIYYD